MREKKDFLLLGEILKQTGLTRKELQALEQLGIFERQGQPISGLREYDESSMILIEGFEFYKAHELPLELVRELLANTRADEPAASVDAQIMLLYTKQDALETQMAALEAAQNLLKAGKKAPWGALTRLIRKELGGRLNFWAEFQAESSAEGLSTYANFDGLWELYRSWKALLIRAALYRQAEVSASEPLGKALGLDYLNWKRSVEVESPGHDEAFTRMQASQTWLKDELFKGVPDYLEALQASL